MKPYICIALIALCLFTACTSDDDQQIHSKVLTGRLEKDQFGVRTSYVSFEYNERKQLTKELNWLKKENGDSTSNSTQEVIYNADHTVSLWFNGHGNYKYTYKDGKLHSFNTNSWMVPIIWVITKQKNGKIFEMMGYSRGEIEEENLWYKWVRTYSNDLPANTTIYRWVKSPEDESRILRKNLSYDYEYSDLKNPYYCTHYGTPFSVIFEAKFAVSKLVGMFYKSNGEIERSFSETNNYISEDGYPIKLIKTTEQEGQPSITEESLFFYE